MTLDGSLACLALAAALLVLSWVRFTAARLFAALVLAQVGLLGLLAPAVTPIRTVELTPILLEPPVEPPLPEPLLRPPVSRDPDGSLAMALAPDRAPESAAPAAARVRLPAPPDTPPAAIAPPAIGQADEPHVAAVAPPTPDAPAPAAPVRLPVAPAPTAGDVAAVAPPAFGRSAEPSAAAVAPPAPAAAAAAVPAGVLPPAPAPAPAPEAMPGPTGRPPAGGPERLFPAVTCDKMVFVIDVSGSMRGERYARVHRELAAILKGQRDGVRFQVLFFDGGLKDWVPGADRTKPQLLVKTAQTLAAAMAKLDHYLTVRGAGTNPLPALHVAIGLRPEEVFLLTDGEFRLTDADLDALEKANPAGAAVHGTLVGSTDQAPLASTVQRVADRFRGLFIYARITAAAGAKK